MRVTVTGSVEPSPTPTAKIALPRMVSAVPTFQPTGNFATHGSRVALGTACAISCIGCPVPHIGAVTVPRVGKNRPTAVSPASRTRRIEAMISATRRMLQRCTEIGRRAGAIDRNSASRSRPSCFNSCRSWVGLATPRVAANASASSSAVKYARAASYTVRASERSASTSIMFPRSTAWRHGDGRTWTKKTSISFRSPRCTIRLAGLMSR